MPQKKHKGYKKSPRSMRKTSDSRKSAKALSDEDVGFNELAKDDKAAFIKAQSEEPVGKRSPLALALEVKTSREIK